MDDRRFDALVKAMATGTNRRSLVKGLLGLGGATVVGSALRESAVDAARRPTPTPKPVTCPGRQTWNGTACVCPGSAPDKCGPDCCNAAAVGPTHSECCDNACCKGTCYGEELCCPTNPRPGELPPTHLLCDGPDGPVCVEGTCCPGTPCPEIGDLCCLSDGVATCVATGECCTVDTDCDNGCLACVGGACVAQCTREECCTAAENRADWFCVAEGQCCTDGDCGTEPCETCDPETHTCGPLCNPETQTCCTDAAGAGTCQTGTCCVGEPCGENALCCADGQGINFCQQGTCCPGGAGCSGDTPNCCGGETKACCASECDAQGLCPTCEPNCYCGDGVVDPATDGLACNGGLAAGGGVCACGYCVVPLDGCPCGCAGDTECVECDGNGGCVPINQGGICNDGVGICDDVWCIDPPPPSCEPNCACSDDAGTPINDGLDCNGGLAAGGGVCGCGYCVVPLDGCPCGCEGNPDCVRCSAAANGTCETYNQGGACNGGTGVCDGEYCVDPPTCQSNEDCGGNICCAGTCLAADECCSSEDCLTVAADICAVAGIICICTDQHVCVSNVISPECVGNSDCDGGTGTCCAGTCLAAGECCTDADCIAILGPILGQTCVGIGGNDLCICTEEHVCLAPL